MCFKRYQRRESNKKDATVKKIIKPANREQLVQIIRSEIEAQGWSADLNHIDVSGVKNLSLVFSNVFNLNEFNGDISKWDVSKVEDMDGMFYHSEFNGDISKWDVSGVQSMNALFFQSKFNGEVSNWDVSQVKDMGGMFQDSVFNQDLSRWNVGHVKSMANMFRGGRFNGDISQWNVSQVVSMGGMFANIAFNGDLSRWDISKVRLMRGMFENSGFDQALDDWNILAGSCITTEMFKGSALLNRLAQEEGLDVASLESDFESVKRLWRKSILNSTIGQADEKISVKRARL